MPIKKAVKIIRIDKKFPHLYKLAIERDQRKRKLANLILWARKVGEKIGVKPQF